MSVCFMFIYKLYSILSGSNNAMASAISVKKDNQESGRLEWMAEDAPRLQPLYNLLKV